MRQLIRRNHKDFPHCLKCVPSVIGICVGECVDRCQPHRIRALHDVYGHAHSNHNCPNVGWICVKHKYLLRDKQLLLHEAAHIIVDRVNNDYMTHGKEWKAALVKLGGTFKPYVFKYKGIEWRHNDYTYRRGR